MGKYVREKNEKEVDSAARDAWSQEERKSFEANPGDTGRACVLHQSSRSEFREGLFSPLLVPSG